MTKKTVKKQAVKRPGKRRLADPRDLPALDELTDADAPPPKTLFIRNIHNTAIYTGTCKLAPGHAVDVDRYIADKLIEVGFAELME